MGPLARGKPRWVSESSQGVGSPNPATHLQLPGEVGCPRPAVAAEGQTQVQAGSRSGARSSCSGKAAGAHLDPGCAPRRPRGPEMRQCMSGSCRCTASSPHHALVQATRAVAIAYRASYPLLLLHLAARMTFKKFKSAIIPLLKVFCLPIALKGETGLSGIAWGSALSS